MPEEDVVFAKEYAEASGLKLIWCLCINANLYIENKTPPIEMLMRNNCPIVLEQIAIAATGSSVLQKRCNH
jgi:hypothetical protein